MNKNDGLCRLTRGWFCRQVFWPAQQAVENAGLHSLAAKIAALDADVHPERYYTEDRLAWERQHMREIG